MSDPRDPTPSPDALRSFMEIHAKSCSQSCAEMLQVELDFSPQSLQLVDQLLPIFHPTGFALESVMHGYAAYVGEVIRRTLGGEWAMETDGSGASLRCIDDAVTIYPFLWMANRVESVRRRENSQMLGEAYFRLLDALGRTGQAPEELPEHFLCDRMGIDPNELYAGVEDQSPQSDEDLDELLEDAEFDDEDFDAEFDSDFEDEELDDGVQASSFEDDGEEDPFAAYFENASNEDRMDSEHSRGDDSDLYECDDADSLTDDIESFYNKLEGNEFQTYIDQMVEQLSTNPSEEQIRESLITAPANSFVLMAASDGKISQAKVVAFANALLSYTSNNNPLVREFFNLAASRVADDITRSAAMMEQENAMLLMPALLVISRRCAEMHAPQHARGFCVALLDIALQVSSAAAQPQAGESRKFTDSETVALDLIAASLGLRS